MNNAVAKRTSAVSAPANYSSQIGGIGELLDAARRASVRAVNAFMTATYWEIGRRIVEFEQGGEKRAGYGEELLSRLADDLAARFGRGFSRFNLGRFRSFYLASPTDQIRATLSLKSSESEKRATPSLKSGEPRIAQTPSAHSAPLETCSTLSGRSSTPFALSDLARAFPLPWSHYVLLISRSRSPEAFAFYHTEALRGGWSVRQLQRQMDSQFYERTALSRNRAAMLAKGAKPQPGDAVSAEEETEVERRLSVVEELESVVSANLQRAVRLRQSILQRAFTGELV